MFAKRHYQSALVGFHLANQTAPQHLQEVCYPRASADHSLRHHNFFQLPKANGAYAKVRASLATALLRGKSIHPLYESLWFVPCLLAVCLLLKRFFSSLARFAGSSATHTQRKNICWVFFVAGDWRRAGVTRRRRSIVDCAAPPSYLSKKQKSKSLLRASTTYLLDSRFTFVCTENFSLVVRCVLQSKSAKSTAQVSTG